MRANWWTVGEFARRYGHRAAGGRVAILLVAGRRLVWLTARVRADPTSTTSSSSSSSSASSSGTTSASGASARLPSASELYGTTTSETSTTSQSRFVVRLFDGLLGTLFDALAAVFQSTDFTTLLQTQLESLTSSAEN